MNFVRVSRPESITNPQTRDRHLMRSLMEEAITSSQLEGVATARDVAKEMIRTGRKPRDTSEQMMPPCAPLGQFAFFRRFPGLLVPRFTLGFHRRPRWGQAAGKGMGAGQSPAHAVGINTEIILLPWQR